MNGPRVFKLKNQERFKERVLCKVMEKSCSMKKEMVMQLVSYSCSIAFNATTPRDFITRFLDLKRPVHLFPL